MTGSHASILIVGAGPVGLSLAIGLARRGLRADIIDMASAPSRFCRAIGITPRTLEVFEAMGVARDILRAGLQLSGRRMIVHRGAEAIVHDQPVDFPELPYSQYGVPQDRTETVLEAALEQRGIRVIRGSRLARLIPGPDGQTVELEREGASETRRYDYVVGCDGAHSAVRKALGIAFEGSAFPYDFMLGDVSIDWDLPRGTSLQGIRPAVDAPPDFFVAIPLPERNRYRVSMMASSQPPGASDGEVAHGIQSERPGASLSQLQAVADRLVPGQPKLSDLRWSSIFRISMRLAARYRIGNVFLAGDACHIHPPTGGQGMNTGIQDADNLAWKLALVARGEAAPVLLDSYEAERRPIAEHVIADTVERSMSIGKPSAPPDRLQDTQIRVSYAEGPIVGGAPQAGLAPGDRMPDIQGLRQRGVGFPLRLFDLTRGPWFTLLAFPGDGDSDALQSIVARLSADFPGKVASVAILRQGSAEPDRPEITVVRAEAEALQAVFDGAPPALILLRPDGYVGYIGAMALDPLRDFLATTLELRHCSEPR